MPLRRKQLQSPPAACRGFTLLELIISVALVLVLMLAITRIFSITSSAIGASQGLAAATRDARAAQAVFARDIGAMANDSPFVWIRSDTPVNVFRNTDDKKSDLDASAATVDLNGNGIETDTGEAIGNFDVSIRSHRLDRFSFCARDRFRRQTGNSAGNVLVSSLSSAEAWVYYGPLCLPRDDGAFYLAGSATLKTNPGDGTSLTNPNNYFPNQWILGRFAPVMILPANAPASDVVLENGVTQEIYPHSVTSFTDGTNMTPFSSATASAHATLSSTIRDARYDLVGVDISAARNIINYFFVNPANPTVRRAWWTNVVSSYFEVNPFINKPINSATVSHQVPVFVPGCSQFIVEFAGDYCTQNNDPAVVSGPLAFGAPIAGNPTPDGEIDFAVVNGQRTIRWYGYPRDTDGIPGIDVTAPGNNGDVVTVSDFVLAINQNYATAATVSTSLVPFEHASVTTRKQHLATDTRFTYYAAWGPSDTNRPKMYRITMVIDRPELAGRTPDGASFEFVFNAPN